MGPHSWRIVISDHRPDLIRGRTRDTCQKGRKMRARPVSDHNRSLDPYGSKLTPSERRPRPPVLNPPWRGVLLKPSNKWDHIVRLVEASGGIVELVLKHGVAKRAESAVRQRGVTPACE